MVDYFGGPGAFKKNVELEYQRNGERYAFLRWGQTAFDEFPRGAARHRHLPPGQPRVSGAGGVDRQGTDQIVKGKKKIGKTIAYPDTLVGTDSHTTMVNGLAVLGWGVGGIEAEAAMLGQPISMLIPEVIGFKLSGKLREGTTATDLVLTVTQMLRKKGVVNKFVEFYGPGLDDLALADRATIANMAPEYGATCGFFPVDAETLRYMKATGRAPARIALTEKYAKAQGMWRDAKTPDPVFTDTLELDISTVESSLAGPKRPQDRVPLTEAADSFKKALTETFSRHADHESRISVKGTNYDLGDGDVVIAAITSCTNTSNPSVMLGRRPDRAQRGEARPQVQAVGEDLARARLAGGHRLSEEVRPADLSRQDRLQPRRLWLHHLHRQFRPAARSDRGCDQRSATWSPPRCSPATATSKAASIRM